MYLNWWNTFILLSCRIPKDNLLNEAVSFLKRAGGQLVRVQYDEISDGKIQSQSSDLNLQRCTDHCPDYVVSDLPSQQIVR